MIDPETIDIYPENGSIAVVSGVDSLPQNLLSMLSMQRGGNAHAPAAGVRLLEYFEEFRGTVGFPSS